MGSRDKMAKNAAPYLEPEETIQVVFGAQTGRHYPGNQKALLSNRNLVVIVTDQRIMIGKSGKFGSKKMISEITRTLPRNTTIGPASRVWWKCETLGNPMYIHKRFHKDVQAADAMISESA